MHPARQDPDSPPRIGPSRRRHPGLPRHDPQGSAAVERRRVDNAPPAAMVLAPLVGLLIWGLLIWGGMHVIGS